MLGASDAGRPSPSTAPFSAGIVPSSRHRSVSEARCRDQAVRRGDLAALALRAGAELPPQAGDFDVDAQNAGAKVVLQFVQPCQELALAAAWG